MGRPINIIVTATKRKRERIASALHLRDLADVSGSDRCRAWTTRLDECDGPQTSAESLYAGDHWQIARDLPRHASAFGWNARLWVCSPGYGLVRAEALLHPYSANYSSRHSDSIVAGLDGDRRPALQRWWHEVSTWPGPEPGQPRSVCHLADNFSDIPILVIASRTVIDVIEPDLIRAAGRMQCKAHLQILSGGSDSAGPLGAHMLPCDARLQSVFGGARMSLNIRTARFLLESCPKGGVSKEWSRRLADVLKNAPPVKRFERTALTDDEVAGFVLRGFHATPSPAWSRLLRQLRDDGYRCEQKRFAAIFKRVEAEIGLR